MLAACRGHAAVGPLLHEADTCLMASVDHYFTKVEHGIKTVQPYHFFRKQGRFSKLTYSEVIDNKLEERSKSGFVTANGSADY